MPGYCGETVNWYPILMIDPPVVFKTAVPDSPKLIETSGPVVEITGAAGSAIAGDTGITD